MLVDGTHEADIIAGWVAYDRVAGTEEGVVGFLAPEVSGSGEGSIGVVDRLPGHQVKAEDHWAVFDVGGAPSAVVDPRHGQVVELEDGTVAVVERDVTGTAASGPLTTVEADLEYAPSAW